MKEEREVGKGVGKRVGKGVAEVARKGVVKGVEYEVSGELPEKIHGNYSDLEQYFDTISLLWKKCKKIFGCDSS